MLPTSCHMSTLVRVRFRPEAIYSASIQVPILSYELNPSHLQTFEIFVNNLVPKSHSIGHPKKRENLTVSKFNEICLDDYISRDKSKGEFHFMIRDLENFQVFDLYYSSNLLFCLFFPEKIDFSRVLHQRP